MNDRTGNEVDSVMVSEASRADARGKFTESVRKELEASTQQIMAITAELQKCSNAAMIRENRRYVVENRGQREWFIRKAQMEADQQKWKEKLNKALDQQKFLNGKLKRENKKFTEIVAKQRGDWFAQLDKLERRVAHLEAMLKVKP